MGWLPFDPDSSVMPKTLSLAPIYDMLPLALAPGHNGLVPQSFALQPPTADRLDDWLSAPTAAVDYWARVASSGTVSDAFRSIARAASETVADRRASVQPTA